MPNWLGPLLGQFYEQSVQLLPKLVVGLIIFLIFLIAARIVAIIVERGFQRTKIDQSLIVLLNRMITTVIIIFGAVTALGTMGMNIGALVAGLGLSGFALSFALKEALSNLLAGISILLYRPFRVGDYV